MTIDNEFLVRDRAIEAVISQMKRHESKGKSDYMYIGSGQYEAVAAYIVDCVISTVKSSGCFDVDAVKDRSQAVLFGAAQIGCDDDESLGFDENSFELVANEISLILKSFSRELINERVYSYAYKRFLDAIEASIDGDDKEDAGELKDPASNEVFNRPGEWYKRTLPFQESADSDVDAAEEESNDESGGFSLYIIKVDGATRLGVCNISVTAAIWAPSYQSAIDEFKSHWGDTKGLYVHRLDVMPDSACIEPKVEFFVEDYGQANNPAKIIKFKPTEKNNGKR